MNTSKKRGYTKRSSPDALRAKCANLVAKVEPYIPFRYVAEVQEVLKNKGFDKTISKIQRVRQGLVGDIEIAEAIKIVALKHKKQLEELDNAEF
jgi:hypothetical protein